MIFPLATAAFIGNYLLIQLNNDVIIALYIQLICNIKNVNNFLLFWGNCIFDMVTNKQPSQLIYNVKMHL